MRILALGSVLRRTWRRSSFYMNLELFVNHLNLSKLRNLSASKVFCTQFKFADLDFIPFLDVHEIIGSLPVVLSDSPILYAYIMMIHLSRIQHAGVDVTVRAISNKMFVPEKLEKESGWIVLDAGLC